MLTFHTLLMLLILLNVLESTIDKLFAKIMISNK
jgi:hypothetical protein